MRRCYWLVEQSPFGKFGNLDIGSLSDGKLGSRMHTRIQGDDRFGDVLMGFPF